VSSLRLPERGKTITMRCCVTCPGALGEVDELGVFFLSGSCLSFQHGLFVSPFRSVLFTAQSSRT